MKVRENIIFLIGNGFDLSHDLKTSYKDFILYYLWNSIKKAVENDKHNYEDDCIKINLNWIVNVDHSKYYLNILKECINDHKLEEIIFSNSAKINGYHSLQIISKSQFIYEILLKCLDSDWNGIEYSIYKVIKSAFLSVKSDIDIISVNPDKSIHFRNANETINQLNISVDCLKKHLIEYLKTLEVLERFNTDSIFNKNTIWGDSISKKIQEHEQDFTRKVLFLNFNYTEYYLKIIDKIKEIVNDYYTHYDSISIHGKLSSNIEDIVFGIGDEQNNFYNDIENYFGDSWLKNMKSFHYFRKENYQKLLGFIEMGIYEIYILGHSCSITDRTLLNMLFENKNCKKIHIYHYKGIESYMKTAYNIARNFNDKVKLRKVLMPFNPYLTTIST